MRELRERDLSFQGQEIVQKEGNPHLFWGEPLLLSAGGEAFPIGLVGTPSCCLRGYFALPVNTPSLERMPIQIPCSEVKCLHIRMSVEYSRQKWKRREGVVDVI